MRARFAALWLTLLSVGSWAIEAPKSTAPERAASASPRSRVTPSDQSAFVARLMRVEHARAVRGLAMPPGVLNSLGSGEIDLAIAKLETHAAQGQHDANIALVRLQHWCSRISSGRTLNVDEQIEKLPDVLQGERAAKAAGVIHALHAYRQSAASSCSRAAFNFERIEAQLRDAAANAHPASAVELAQLVRDPQKRNALLKQAMAKDYAPALYAAATQLLMAVQRGQTTENVSAIRLYLKQAGRTLPRAKLDLANCMALGCDGHPADALGAHAFGLDAARDGEPTAFLSMLRMPWGARLSRQQHLAWQQFGQRLNEAVCFGEAYVPSAVQFAQSIAMLEKDQDERTLASAREQAEALWSEHSARAMQEQGCSVGAAND